MWNEKVVVPAVTIDAFCVLLFIYKPNYTWPGLLLILIGLPVYYLINRKNSEN
jgi:APA family basic amino acid/polyamine antiporter